VDISVADLIAQYERASQSWPFIDAVEVDAGLPRCLLYAVGSRETNLTNEPGDWGLRDWPPFNQTRPQFNAYGVWQRDIEHGVGPAYLADVHQQAADAAAELVGWFRQWGDWREACNGYNSGQPTDAGTAHGDYGPDVMARLAVLQFYTQGEEFTLDSEARAAFQDQANLINEFANCALHGNRNPKTGAPDPTHYGLDQVKLDFIRIEGEQARQAGLLEQVLAVLCPPATPAPTVAAQGSVGEAEPLPPPSAAGVPSPAPTAPSA